MEKRGNSTMEFDKLMKIVLIEDSATDVKKFIECQQRRQDFVLEITDDSNEAIEFVKNKLPDAVIVDLELNWGRGSGTDFLRELNELHLPLRPIIVVNTRNRSDMVQAQIHEEFRIEHMYSKEKDDYSADKIISDLFCLRQWRYKQQAGRPDFRNIDTPEELEKRLRARIRAEMDEFGITPKYKGYKIAEESIYRLIQKKKLGEPEKVFNDIAKDEGKNYTSIHGRLEEAIKRVWCKPHNIERLSKVYTAHVCSENGIPTPTEFIHFYADKILDDM